MAITTHELALQLNAAKKKLDQGRFKEAVDAFARAAGIDPQCSDAYLGLAWAHTALKNREEALLALVRLIELRPRGHLATKDFVLAQLFQLQPAVYIGGIAEYLHDCLTSPQLAGTASALLLAQLFHKHDLQRLKLPFSSQIGDAIRQLLSDSHLQTLMRDHLIADWRWERVLTEIRRQLLSSLLRQENPKEDLQPVAIALAHQCFLNDFVYFETEEETLHIEELWNNSGGVWSERLSAGDVPASLLACLMYRPLWRHPDSATIARIPLDRFGDAFRTLVTRTLLEPIEEDNYKARLPLLSPITETTSIAVGSQYEEHPYPRWAYVDPDPPSIAQRLKAVNPPTYDPGFDLDGPIDILIAGAGTGQHPIYCALGNPNAHIVALDLSAASLAYGSRMAQRLGVTNIEFIQGDILDLPKLGKTFHVIESVGVLHHMRDPIAGWKTLVDVLHEAGVMKIALYSAAGRQPFEAARAKVLREKIPGDATSIRRFRRELIDHAEDPAYAELSEAIWTKDFYTLPDCRDLLFHVQEVFFTWDEIEEALSGLNLVFLGVEGALPHQTLRELMQQNLITGKANMADIELWKRLERLRPLTFNLMYHFWCVKRV